MKYEVKFAENSIIKTFIVMAFYIFVLIFSMYSFAMKSYDDAELFNKILNYLNYPIFSEYNFVDNLLYIFNAVYFVLYFVIFYVYEYICFHDHIATRFKTKRWVSNKYLIGIMVVILISLVQYGCICSIFGSSMPSSIKYYIYPIIYKIFIMSFIYTLFNLFKTNKLAFLIAMFVVGYASLNFNIIFYTLLIIGSFLLNYLFFDLRLFKYVFSRRYHSLYFLK